MGKHGQQWLDALEEKELMYDPAETDQFASEGKLSSYEEEARAIAKDLKEDKIPDGIASCISRGSDRLGLPVRRKFFCSQAFQELKEWAEEQGLILGICSYRDIDNNSDENYFLLAISPDRGQLTPNDLKKVKAS